MSQTHSSIPTFSARPVRTAAEIQEAKRQEKLQSHASSHRVAGTHLQKASAEAGSEKR